LKLKDVFHNRVQILMINRGLRIKKEKPKLGERRVRRSLQKSYRLTLSRKRFLKHVLGKIIKGRERQERLGWEPRGKAHQEWCLSPAKCYFRGKDF